MRFGSRHFWPVFLFAPLVLSGCSDEASGEGEATAFRVVDAVEADASCDVGEMLLSAYCFSDQGRSISASGPALQPNADGTIVATCLTGGRHLRLFCLKQP
jgi:hypothetical protein